ncbi:MAG: AraC family transcriptional regulator [Erysipelotrichaceae bacterium]|nr:AraC family transcriptional regulator [Erysipelotrichaceae bacterium]
MNKFNTFIENFYKYSLVPLTVLKNENVLINFPKDNNTLSLINYLYFKKTFDEIDFKCFKDNVFMAQIPIYTKKEKLKLIIGPVVKRNLTIDDALDICKYLKMPNKIVIKVSDELTSLIKMDFDDFIKLIIFLNYSINFTNITYNDILKNTDLNTIRKYKTIHYPKKIVDNFDNNLKEVISQFDHIKFMSFLNNIEVNINEKQLENNLINYKSGIIFYLSRISKHIIDLGVDYKTIDNLIFKYIIEINKLDNYIKIEETFKEAIKKIFDLSNKLKPQTKYRQIVKNLIEYINNNIDNNLQVNNLAKVFGMNRSYISKAFIDDTGINIQSYIQNLRLEKAKDLLLNTEYTIKEISDKLNFSSQSHFQSLFKKQYNLTPTQFKNNIKN